MSTLTLTRTPRYMRTVSFANATYFKLELYIFTGVVGSKPATPTYTINKDTINGETQVTFEINELIKDYYELNFDGTYTTSEGQTLWAIADITPHSDTAVGTLVSTTFLAFDGFNYFEESVNRTYTLPTLWSVDKIQVLDTEFAVIPINAEIAETINYKLNGVTVSTFAITDSGDTNQKIQYIKSGALAVDSVDVVYDSGTKTITTEIETIDECKYPVSKIVFLNKYGALQNLYFFKKSIENLQVQRESFQRNILDESLPYISTFKFTEHQNNDFNITASESIVLNSGFVSESMNSTFKELLLSESIWIVRDGNTYPVNLVDSGITYKTGLNDKLINYTLNFKYAFNTINNVH